MNAVEEAHDHLADVKRFDDTKKGVKGLLDSGLTTLPRYFIHPPDILAGLKPNPVSSRPGFVSIPAIDLSGVRDSSSSRLAAVDKVASACREFGFFQIVNHGIPVDLLDRMLAAVKGFHELPAEEKAEFYGRTSVGFFSNVDLFRSKAASWRDTLQLALGPTLPELEKIPEVVRNEVVEWNVEIKRLGELLMELLCEGLGIDKERFKKMTFLDARMMVCHYYPQCPQPDLTLGISSHTDPGILTLLLQNQVAGLQVKHGEDWLDVNPLPGAFVVNVGDIFQIMSNDKYRSVEHRVLANPCKEARVSIAVFFNASARENLYGPLPELLSPESPALYKEFLYVDDMKGFFSKELNGKTLTDFYKVL